MTMSTRSQISAQEVEKAEAIAGFAAGQQARASGHNPAAIKALAAFGTSTFVGELELLPLGLQVQLCLMEHAQLFESDPSLATSNSELLSGLKRLTRLAYIFSDPEAAYDTLTQNADDDTKRRDFDRESFALARHFQGAAAIDLLNGHLSKEMGLLEDANPPLPVITEKKTLRRERPAKSRR